VKQRTERVRMELEQLGGSPKRVEYASKRRLYPKQLEVDSGGVVEPNRKQRLQLWKQLEL